MTAKDKAMELMDKFYDVEIYADYGASASIDAKECALICVDEILKSNIELFGQMDNDDSWYDDSYWQEVKQEIDKL